jgi:hypothetical protein
MSGGFLTGGLAGLGRRRSRLSLIENDKRDEGYDDEGVAHKYS